MQVLAGGKDAIFVELEASAKAAVLKEKLATYEPDRNFVLDYNETTILRAWLAARYRRASFSDEFDRRITRVSKKFFEKLLKLFKSSSDDIMGVYFDVDDGEEVSREGPSDTFELFITLVYNVDKDPGKAQNVVERVAKELKDLFREYFFDTGRWQNIELVGVAVIAETALTVHQERLMKRYNLDYISLREGQPVAN